jgi:hypothetical protein
MTDDQMAAESDYTPAMRIRHTLHQVNGDLKASDPDLFAAGVRFVIEIACRECKTETWWTAGDVVACRVCSAHAAGLYCGDRQCGPCSFDRVAGKFGSEVAR